MTQINARLDCVENLTRQRHDRDQTENQQNAATVGSCFELVGSRQHGVARTEGTDIKGPILGFLRYALQFKKHTSALAVNHPCKMQFVFETKMLNIIA